MSELNERLDDLREQMQEQDFLSGNGLSNEVNIRMFCYDAKDEMTVRHFTEKLLADKTMSCRVIEYNLYHIFLSICDDKRITDRIPALEEKKGKHFILEQLTRMATNIAFVNKMKAVPHNTGDVILITGVGEAFPFIRVHALLEAMQPHYSDVPIVVMYPGKFENRNSLILFDRLKPNWYYRAFNV